MTRLTAVQPRTWGSMPGRLKDCSFSKSSMLLPGPTRSFVCVCVCVRACVRARVCVRACVRARVCVMDTGALFPSE
jgi:hypothetical protein